MTTFSISSSTVSPAIASITQPAPGVGRRNVVTGFIGTYVNSAGAIASGTLVLRDAAAGVAPTVLLIAARTIAAGEIFIFSQIFETPFIGSENTATTVEFTSIVGAGGAQTCTIMGYVI